MITPEFQPALTALKEGQYTLNPTHPLQSHNPLPPPSYILIRVSFVALNPCNWKMIDFSPAIGTVGGNDFSGRVVAIGSAVRKWQIGHSVCGFSTGWIRMSGRGNGLGRLPSIAGYSPITTCSPSHNALVQSYGTIKAFDYRSASCGVAIRAFTKGKLSLILDCITSTDSMKNCYAAMGARGGRYIALESPATRNQTAH
ncbi:hypothetical protein AARAC_003584 [Aspergillus arachidicola]|uniref:Alcohol dehydrogenase-like N-terminal domain-containing protein n=1 Tax=Aspergillus arachidicola TaxID=656916 RepID=A0A2G7FEG9_9EURO|nr:hypothetical protein AARAC_003584 [Aspergillus arachidicola]